MNNYWLGDLITIYETFTVYDENADPPDVPTNPDAVTFTVVRPDGIEDVYVDTDPEVANPSTGLFQLEYDPPAVGHYDYRVEGTGAAQAAIEGEFHVYSRVESSPAMPQYVTPHELAGALRIAAEGDAFDDLDRACNTASRAVDEVCDSVFGLSDDSNDEVRVFTALSPSLCQIDDAASVTLVEIDRLESNVWTELDEGTDFVLERVPVASVRPAERPYNRVLVRQSSSKTFPRGAQTVRVTGRFGWSSTPWQIVEATGLLAQQLFKRRQESPFGVLSFQGGDQAAVVRILRKDPHICELLEPFMPSELG